MTCVRQTEWSSAGQTENKSRTLATDRRTYLQDYSTVLADILENTANNGKKKKKDIITILSPAERFTFLMVTLDSIYTYESF